MTGKIFGHEAKTMTTHPTLVGDLVNADVGVAFREVTRKDRWRALVLIPDCIP
jgi:hypothetical protein